MLIFERLIYKCSFWRNVGIVCLLPLSVVAQPIAGSVGCSKFLTPSSQGGYELQDIDKATLGLLHNYLQKHVDSIDLSDRGKSTGLIYYVYPEDNASTFYDSNVVKLGEGWGVVGNIMAYVGANGVPAAPKPGYDPVKSMTIFVQRGCYDESVISCAISSVPMEMNRFEFYARDRAGAAAAARRLAGRCG